MVDFRLLLLAFGFGIVAAAPIGPVNMVAIRRGLVSRWTHTLWVGLGSVIIEAGCIAAALYGYSKLLEETRVQKLEYFVGLPAAAVIALIGAFITRKAVRHPHRVLADARLERARGNTTILRDVATGAALTLINPATWLYWMLGAGPAWLHKANLPPGCVEVWWALLAAVAGLASWFLLVATLVRLRPRRVGPGFFRIVNAACGIALMIIGVVLAIKAIR